MKTLLLSHDVTFRKQAERRFTTKISNNTSVSSRLSNFTKSPTWFHDLPLEVLLKIFSNFSEKELRKNIIPVCQKWRYAALKPQLWKCFEVVGGKIPLNRICYEINRFPYLQIVVLKSVHDPKQIIRQVCRCLSNLKELTIKDCEEIPEKTLINVLYSCRNLEKLNLSGTPFRGKKVFEDISLLPNLKSLNLAKNPYITIQKLTTCVLNCTGLEEFRLSKWVSLDEILKFDDQDVSPILLNLSSSLRSLTLDCSNLTTNSFNKIFTCNCLERLSLHRAKHLDGEMFAKLHRYFPALTVLKVKHASQISDANIVQLFTEGEEIMENLQTLDLSGCWQITA
ncbi:uncharacterized F-box/LRR-repeat protein C02F5.7-like isoform X2 [Agrilus planipennis]|uniref:Uncharacterized F-box/LRR-repeat protein C02F5.7-like isoform X2 n=1 Tax=Agrilus planipennis TaxID=224129 RepID=A0A1W4XE86_AGRPL|nr:uncharacterized F-box/LRR-repeat protein C02F5.7-like isoform X2 [Agrilus planipennis]